MKPAGITFKDMAEAAEPPRGAATVALAAAAAVLLAAIAAVALGTTLPSGFWLHLPTGQQPLRLQLKQAGSLLTPVQLAKWRQFASARCAAPCSEQAAACAPCSQVLNALLGIRLHGRQTEGLLGTAPAGKLLQPAPASRSVYLIAPLPAPRRQCSLAEADYSQIFSDLAPFRRAGGISDTDVAAAAAALPAATAVLTLRGGRAMDEDEAAKEEAAGQGSPAQQQQQQSQLRPPRRLPWGGLGYYRRLMADFQGELPDMKLLFNFGDRPRSWTARLPPANEAALRAGALGVQAAWEQHGCDAAVGSGMRRKHGLFQAGRFWGARGPLPVLSGWRVEGCFSGEARGS